MVLDAQRVKEKKTIDAAHSTNCPDLGVSNFVVKKPEHINIAEKNNENRKKT